MYQPEKKVKEGEKVPPREPKVSNEIRISTKTSPEHIFKYNRFSQWDYVSPWQDRADGITHIRSLIEFTLGAQVVDSFPAKGKDLSQYGLENNYTRVSFRSESGDTILTYRVGKKAAWHKKKTIKASKTVPQDTVVHLPTVYIQKENTDDSGTIYLVADPLLSQVSGVNTLFKNEFEGFRHHSPFALNVSYLEEIYIKHPDSEILLDRSTVSSPWRIAKPLDLATDKSSIKNLLVNLSKLSATKLHKTDSVTLPQETEGRIEISVKSFSVDEWTKLTIYPAKEGEDTCYAKVSDRDIIFELPLKSAENIDSSIADIPENINALRAKNMLTLDKSKIRGFTITKRYGTPVVVSRPRAKFPLQILLSNNKNSAVNLNTLTDFFKAVSTDPVRNFVSDAATDFNKYGLNDPILQVRMFTFSGNKKPTVLRFSKVLKELTEEEQKTTPNHLNGVVEYIYANVVGTPVVWEVNPASYARIASNEWNWKPNTIWELAVNEIQSFTIQHQGRQSLIVKYNYYDDEFTAKSKDRDLTNHLNPNKAKFFLNSTHQLTTSKRLGPDNPIAKKALEKPALTVSISVQMYDDFNAPTELKKHTISFAPVTRNSNRSAFYYAKSNVDDDYFLIDAKTYFGFSLNLFEED